ncbi:MAG TPA: AAA family ATPase [Myxococcales bacterium]|jgi:SpoVK/Ycf46/Vps4 family AAA+-type ATPase
MAKTRKKTDPLDSLPSWARELAERYFTKTVATFLLHGAVRDLQPTTDAEGNPRFVPLKTYLAEDLFAARDIVLHYDRSSGIRAATPEMQKDFLRAVEAYDTMYGSDFAKALPKDPGRALQIVENYMRVRIADNKSVALIIDFAETLAPAGELGHMGQEDRFTLVTLVKWANDPTFLSADLSICLICENLAELAPRLARNPYAASISIDLPNEDERRLFVKTRLEGKKLSEVSDIPVEGLAKMTAGLSRVHLDRVLTEAIERAIRITPEGLKQKKKEIIQAECQGLLEFIEPHWTLDNVAGHEKVKELLRGAATALRKGRTDVVPMGYLIGGPVGTGKTFITTCFAGDIGVPCVKFLNFRSQWQGVTEGNLEKIFNLLKAMWPVAVVIDEADAFLGDRNQGGDSGTSNRIFASIASFMGNTEYRGKIIWFLLTCRPDLLPIDLKRQGRAEEHLALFYPQTDPERDDLFKIVAKKTGVPIDGIESYSKIVPENLRDCSGADIEAALVRAKFRAMLAGREKVTTEDLQAVLANFIPPSYPMEIELQNLAAVQECTSRELLPENYRKLDRAFVTQRIRELKALLEEQ